MDAIAKVDWAGVVLLIAATALLVFALQEGGFQYAWKSAIIIATLAVSLACWIGFGVWEYYLAYGSKFNILPIFPLHLVKNRVVAATLG
jgi:hypothetical protein